MGICFPWRICWFSIFLVVQKQFAWKIDLTYLCFWCCRKREKHIWGSLWGFKETAVLYCDACTICRVDSICKSRQVPQFPWWDKQQESRFQEELTLALSSTAGQPRAAGTTCLEGIWAWVGREQMCFHPSQPLLDRKHWTCSLMFKHEHESWGNQRDNSPLSFQTTLTHTYSNSALRLGIWVEILTQTTEKFRGFQIKFSWEEKEVACHDDTA